MERSTQLHVEVDDNKPVSRETMYADNPITTLTPKPQAPIDHAMLRGLENKWDSYRLAAIVRTSAQQVKKLTDQEDKRARERADEIDAILEELSRIETISPRFAQNVTLKRTLDVLRLPEYEMSAATNVVAERLFREFERQNWGEPVILATSTTPSRPNTQDSAKSRASRAEPVDGPSGIAVSGAVTEESLVAQPGPAKPTPKDVKEVVHFDDDHPVFGNDGTMRGIKVRLNKTKNTLSYFLNKSLTHKRADIIGHNRLNVGDCWPYMICLVRDGVHGSSQGGIYGNEVTGAYSIIVLGDSAYAGMDQDSGNVLFYSGSGSLENTDPDHAKETAGTKALQTSALKKQAVRVIRGKNKARKDSPRAGFRYDGLYKVVAQKELKNGKGGAFIQFELRRLEDQAPIDTSRPDADEQKVFQVVKDVKLRD